MLFENEKLQSWSWREIIDENDEALGRVCGSPKITTVTRHKLKAKKQKKLQNSLTIASSIDFMIIKFEITSFSAYGTEKHESQKKINSVWNLFSRLGVCEAA